MTKGKGTQIGTDAKPMILGKKRRRPTLNSQAYKDNYDKIFGKKERTTTYSEQMQEELEPIFKKWKKVTLKEEHQLYLMGMS